jgi:hypothetical protein
MTPGRIARRLIPSDQAVVVLDTVILLDLCRESVPWIDTFERMSSDGYAFCFADIVVPEVLNALARGGSLTREQLAVGVRAAERFVLRSLPFLPGPRELNVMTGAIIENDEDVLDEVRAHLAAVWRLFGTAEVNSVEYEHDGQEFVLPLANGTSGTFVRDERGAWCGHFRGLTAILRETDADDDVLEAMRRKVDSDECCDPPMSHRLDLMLKYLQFRYRQHGKPPRYAYKPESPKRENDGIDFRLFYALLAPALIVTRDGDMLNTTRQIPSYQSGWVLTPHALAAAWSNGCCPKPAWSSPA